MLPLTLSISPLTTINQQIPQASPAENASTSLPIKDIHLPQAISPWPPAIGWWILILLFIIGVYYLYRFSQKRIQQYKQQWGYRKSALRLLEQCYKESATQNNQTTTNAIMRLLKRTAMSAYPKKDIEALYGETWIEFLNSCTKEAYFHGQIVTLFDEQQYQKQTNTIIANKDINALHHAVKQWINHHDSSNQLLKNLNKQDANDV